MCESRQQVGWRVRGISESAAIVGCRLGQAEPKQLNEIHGGARGMLAAAQITQAVQPLDGERQAGEQPSDQAVGVMMADMLEVVAVFAEERTNLSTARKEQARSTWPISKDQSKALAGIWGCRRPSPGSCR
jgi:hypothetical protein